VYDHLSFHFSGIDQLAEARAFGQRALAIAKILGDLPLQVTANLDLGIASVASGDYVGGERFFRSVVQLLPGDLSRERFGQSGFPAVLSRAWLAWSLAERGEFGEGITHGLEGVQLGEAVAQPYSLIAACWRLSYLYTAQGEYPHAMRLLERALTLSRERNILFFAPVVTWSLGYVFALSGRIPEGLSLQEQALTIRESQGLRGVDSLLVAHLGETYLLADRGKDALAAATRALTLAREHGLRGHEAWARRLLGEVASHQDPPNIKEAEGQYRQAIGVAEELGMRPLIARCHFGLGQLYRRGGRAEQAQPHLSTARTMFREMGMRFWLERTEAETKEPAGRG
jgi:tetratricopeptide (TPR) repeat protein